VVVQRGRDGTIITRRAM